jgi:ATP-dependent DNA ligase
MKPLYKKARTGKISFWQIEVIHHADKSEIRTLHGQVGGVMTPSSELVTEGKNIGMANETSIQDQAQAQALSRWEKQKKRGYVESLEDAQEDKVDSSVVKGGVVPMAAHLYEEYEDDIIFPWLGQPKLDGIRAILIKFGKDVSIWSKERNRFYSCPHIEDAVRDLPEDFVMDGELYNHAFKDDFNKIVSLVKNGKATEETKMVQFWAFDLVADKIPFTQRLENLSRLVKLISHDSIVQVETIRINSKEELTTAFRNYMDQKYEGLMIRDPNSEYIHGRCNKILKVKDFIDAEFEILGIEEGVGKLAGRVANFIVKVSDTITAKARAKCSLERAKELFENPELWTGKKVTVRFQNYTPKGSLRHPRAIEIRDYE